MSISGSKIGIAVALAAGAAMAPPDTSNWSGNSNDQGFKKEVGKKQRRKKRKAQRKARKQNRRK